jgi:hypothetical protein
MNGPVVKWFFSEGFSGEAGIRMSLELKSERNQKPEIRSQRWRLAARIIRYLDFGLRNSDFNSELSASAILNDGNRK